MNSTNRRTSPLEMDPELFRALGHEVVDRMAEFLTDLPRLPLTKGESPGSIRNLLGRKPLPSDGIDASRLLRETAELLVEHSLFNGHRNFYGYITSSAAPIGSLGDFMAACINPNLGSFVLSPIATEIEAQTIRWIAELIGFPVTCGGILVSGGNMANFVCFLAARKAMATWDIRAKGIAGNERGTFRVYTSTETHTWISKAADMFGLGTDAVRWIPSDKRQRIDLPALRKAIVTDRGNGDVPFLVVGTAGTVSTGAVDPLPELAALCKEEKLWFHVDGAYGGFAAGLPETPEDLKGLSFADSVAIDPHKWLYAPLEVGCALVRKPEILRDAFSFHVPYYRFHDSEDEAPLNFFEYGPQNSRGFRALKVWLALRQAGRNGYAKMISDDITLARELAAAAAATEGVQVLTQELSITTLRYIPPDLAPGTEQVETYLNRLNEELLMRLQRGGDAFLSNAVLNGMFVLRACIVNFRTSLEDVRSLPEIIVRLGREVDADLRPGGLT